MGKKAVGVGRNDEVESSGVSSGELKRGKKKHAGPVPAWAYYVGMFSLLVCLGQVFFAPSKDAVSEKKASGMSKNLSTARLLEVSLRLKEMTNLAAAVVSMESIDREAVQELQEELLEIKAEIDGASGTVARDLRSLVSIISGTLFKTSERLTDEEVEAVNPGFSFTYSSPRYWEDVHYQKNLKDETYDWYATWDAALVGSDGTSTTLAEQISPLLSRNGRILMLGCGNSDMSEKMYQAGFNNIVNIDIADRALEIMKEKTASSMPEMSWLRMNVSALSFEDAEFDFIIDKGTFDAIELNVPLLESAISEAKRVLKPSGALISVTFNHREKRVDNQLKDVSWDNCATSAMQKPDAGSGVATPYFVHSCIKRSLV